MPILCRLNGVEFMPFLYRSIWSELTERDTSPRLTCVLVARLGVSSAPSLLFCALASEGVTLNACTTCYSCCCEMRLCYRVMLLSPSLAAEVVA